MRKIEIFLLFSVVCLTGCTDKMQRAFMSERKAVQVLITVEDNDSVRSGTISDENEVSDINLWAYHDGRLDAACYGEPEMIEPILLSNTEYHIFALANCGRKVQAPKLETELQDFLIGTCYPSENKRLIPMANAEPTLFIHEESTSLEVRVQRLFSKWAVNIKRDSASRFSSLKVTEIVIHNIPSEIAPFRRDFLSEDSLPEGDFADSADLAELNTNGTAIFFVPENIPEANKDASQLPFLEMKAIYSYEKRPADNMVFSFSKGLNYEIPLGDRKQAGLLVRSTAYVSDISYSDWGFLSDAYKWKIRNVDEETLSYIEFFSGYEGRPIERSTQEYYEDVTVWCRIVGCDPDNISLSVSPSPEEVFIEGLGVPELIEGDWYKISFHNKFWLREEDQTVCFTLKDNLRKIERRLFNTLLKDMEH